MKGNRRVDQLQALGDETDIAQRAFP